MIKIEEITQIINQSLNANTLGEEFKLFADLGAYTQERKRLLGSNAPIPGLVRSLGGDFVPLKDLDSYKDTLSIEMFIPEARLENVRIILTDYITSQVGLTTVIGEYDVSFNMAPPSVGSVEINSFGGIGVPIQLFIFLQVGKSALLSNSATISINGEEILLLNANITRGLLTSSNSFESSPNVMSYFQTQLLSISGQLPIKKSGISRTLKQMILQGTLYSQTFEISYNDGQDTAVYTMLPSGDWSFNLQAGAYASINVGFVEKAKGE